MALNGKLEIFVDWDACTLVYRGGVRCEDMSGGEQQGEAHPLITAQPSQVPVPDMSGGEQQAEAHPLITGTAQPSQVPPHQANSGIFRNTVLHMTPTETSIVVNPDC
jgi:hypothetical protein